jgi:hypothetical protein
MGSLGISQNCNRRVPPSLMVTFASATVSGCLTEKSPARVRARPLIGATFRKVKELAYTQIGITCDGAAAINDGVDAIARNNQRQ